MSREYPDKNNPFADDDLPSKTSQYGGYGSSASGGGSSGSAPVVGWGDDADFEKPRSRYEQLQDMKQNSMNNQLDTTQRMLSSIYESERMGHATAEELVHQGEQLDNVERKTDDMNKTMDTSQKHLNNIKSIFGGIKNWWTKGKEETPKEEPEKAGPRSDRLKDAMGSDKSHLDLGGASEHPALRIRNDTSGFHDDSSSRYGRSKEDDPFRSNDPFQEDKQQFSSPSMQQYDKQFNQNIDLMSDGMSRLKGLAMGLGDEIGKQNDQVDRIQTKVEKTDTKLEARRTGDIVIHSNLPSVRKQMRRDLKRTTEPIFFKLDTHNPWVDP